MKQLCEGEFPLEIKGPESQRDLAGLLIPRCSPLLVICALHPPTTAASADRSLSQGVLRFPPHWSPTRESPIDQEFHLNVWGAKVVHYQIRGG